MYVASSGGPLVIICFFVFFPFFFQVFNGTAFNMVHIIIGHHGPVTSKLVTVAADDAFIFLFFFFLENKMTFHVNCLLGRQFT